MSKIHFLQVKHGDSFVIECDKGGNHGIIAVDGGPKGYGKVLDAKIQELGVPDLMVLTHYDDDHIGGLTQYVQSRMREGQAPAKETWANCKGWPNVEDTEMPLTRSITQGVNLARVLETCVDAFGMRWNAAVCEGFVQEFPFASVEVISPTEEVMDIVIEKQAEQAAKTPMRAKKL